MKRSGVGFAVVLAGLLAACGGDDGGSVRNNDARATAGSSGAKVEGVVCGSETCTVPKGAAGEACCKDQFSSTCGVTTGGACGAVQKSDERCPVPDLKLVIPAGSGIQQPVGCCTTDSECGVDFGVGCQSRTVLCMGIGLDQVDKLKRQTCDGKDLPLPADCGTMMVTLPVPGQM
jgi:hypothetical protein